MVSCERHRCIGRPVGRPVVHNHHFEIARIEVLARKTSQNHYEVLDAVSRWDHYGHGHAQKLPLEAWEAARLRLASHDVSIGQMNASAPTPPDQLKLTGVLALLGK